MEDRAAKVPDHTRDSGKKPELFFHKGSFTFLDLVVLA